MTTRISPEDRRPALLPARLSAASALVVAILVSLSMPVLRFDRGVIDTEATQFVRQYLDDRGPLQKIFDPKHNDLGTYQARELSYAIDYVDAQALAWLLSQGVVLLVPLSGWLASVLLAAAMVFFAWRHRLHWALWCGLLLIYLTNYVQVVSAAVYYRSAKPMLAPLALLATFQVASVVRNASPPLDSTHRRIRQHVAMALLLGAMGLLDRQGFGLAALAAFVLVWNAVIWGQRRDAAVVGVAVVLLLMLYNAVLGPWIIHAVNGYEPSLAYQRIPLDGLRDTETWTHAIYLILESVSILLGGVPHGVAAVLIAGTFIAFAVTAPNRRGSVLVLGGLLALAYVGMYAAMIARHPAIYGYLDHRQWYYPVPSQAVWVALLALLLTRLPPLWSRRRLAFAGALAVTLIGLNVYHWDRYDRRQVRSSLFLITLQQSHGLKASLSAQRPRWFLRPEFRSFYALCASLSRGV